MKHKIALLLLVSLFILNGTQAQDKKNRKKTVLNALVIDGENNPIQNASVFVDGKKKNVLSDADGRFKIKLKSSTKMITIFTLFNGEQELAYNGENELTFILSSTERVKEDPLNKAHKEKTDFVNVGYGNKRKKNLTTSVGEVSNSRLKNSYQYNTIFDMIVGEVPGVVVSGTSITIRGKSSVNMSTEPLFVVNGIATSNIMSISPSDVKSISVLKGASASIYGSRGSNGVILITLKSARNK